LLIYDGKCSFCMAWIRYWRQITRGIEYAPSQEVKERFLDIPEKNFAEAVQLVLPNREVRSGAHAVFTALATAPEKRWMLRVYEKVPPFAVVAEAVYAVCAWNRSLSYWMTKLLWGIPIQLQTNIAVVEVFQRLLGVIYLIAFLSFGVQSRGLIGEHGILPVGDLLDAAHRYYGGKACWLLPTMFWIAHSNAAIAAVWIAGSICSVCLMFGVVRRFSCFAAFGLYLSLVSAGRIFMGYQWDALLLEAGFLAIFLRWSRVITWLFRWLLFRLMFMSGAVKLLSGDVTLRDLTALTYHYHTQPLPTPLAWYVDKLPASAQRFSTAATLTVELLVPFFVFLPRRPRLLAAWIIAIFQTLIMLTGNYTFFNLLTIALCVMLFEDRDVARCGLRRWVEKLQSRFKAGAHGVRRVVAISVAGLVFGLSLISLSEGLLRFAPEPLMQISIFFSPFPIANSYGLFANMTTTRPEVVLEASDDGVQWQEYKFKYKAGNVMRRPRWVAPYQPRLDWQMWFSALGTYDEDPWFLHFVRRLLQGEPDVLRLLQGAPAKPPKYIRAWLYDYRFTTSDEHRQTGAWWHRERMDMYMPKVSLEDFAER